MRPIPPYVITRGSYTDRRAVVRVCDTFFLTGVLAASSCIRDAGGDMNLLKVSSYMDVIHGVNVLS